MLFVGAGREAGIRPGDLVGAITGEAGINSRELGAIQIAERFSLVEVPASRAEEIIAALRATTIRGRKVPVRRDRERFVEFTIVNLQFTVSSAASRPGGT